MYEVSILQLFGLGLACFSLGMAAANLIYIMMHK